MLTSVALIFLFGLLFVLVGATVNLRYAVAAGIPAVCVIILALQFRMMGVAISVSKTNLSKKERFFCMVAYTPKATVQAAIGAVPLSLGLACGNMVLTVAVLSILITAPFGAICIKSYWIKKVRPQEEVDDSKKEKVEDWVGSRSSSAFLHGAWLWRVSWQLLSCRYGYSGNI